MNIPPQSFWPAVNVCHKTAIGKNSPSKLVSYCKIHILISTRHFRHPVPLLLDATIRSSTSYKSHKPFITKVVQLLPVNPKNRFLSVHIHTLFTLRATEPFQPNYLVCVPSSHNDRFRCGTTLLLQIQRIITGMT